VPAHGSVTLQADGSFTYTPNSGYSGDDSFQYVAEDGRGGNSAPATVTIHVASAPSGSQRLTVVAGGKHPAVLSGRVVEGSFDIVSNNRRISSVSGTGTIKDRKDRTWVVTIEATKSGRGYTAKIRISKNGHRTRSWSGSGILVKRGRNAVGAFRDHRTHRQIRSLVLSVGLVGSRRTGGPLDHPSARGPLGGPVPPRSQPRRPATLRHLSPNLPQDGARPRLLQLHRQGRFVAPVTGSGGDQGARHQQPRHLPASSRTSCCPAVVLVLIDDRDQVESGSRLP
jgi:hypothetical protein